MQDKNSQLTASRGWGGMRREPPELPGYMDQSPERYSLCSAPNRDPGTNQLAGLPEMSIAEARP